MAQATGSAARLTIQAETTWGVLPTTPNSIEINAATYGDSFVVL